MTSFDLGGSTVVVDPPASPPQVVVPVPGPPGAAGGIQSVVAGTNVTVDDTDPANPVVSATGGGTGGAVDSVNGQTGVVVLAAADVGADEAGAAAAAVATAHSYTDAQLADEVTRADAAYDPAGAANVAAGLAQTAAQTYTDGQVTAERDRAQSVEAAKADLVGGLVPTSQIPALALTNTVTVASQAAMLALTTTQVQPGDLAVRTDGAGTFILTATDPSVLANWTRLNAPTDAVTSVNGQTGTVNLSAADVGADAAGAAAAAQAFAVQRANHTGTQSADTLTDGTTNKAFLATERTKLAGIAPGATAVTVGAAGSGAGNALSANDATTTNSRTPTAHAATHGSAGSDPVSIAASQVTSGQFAMARIASGTPDGTKFVRDDGTLATPSGGGGGGVPVNFLAPSGALAETHPRQFHSSGSGQTIAVSGTLALAAIPIPAGVTIGRLLLVTGTAATSPTHWWLALFDSSRVMLACSADQTTTAWPSLSVVSAPVATTAAGASTSFTTTYTGLYYLGWMMTASARGQVNAITLPTPVGLTTAPILCGGTTDTGMTTPPAFPFTAGAISSPQGQHPYGYVTA